MGPSDGTLFEQWAAARDADAFAEIVARHSAMVYGTCRRVLGNASDAEDVAQECFIELARPGTTIKRSLGGWLHRAAVHRSLNRIKAEKRRKRREARFAARTGDRGEMEWDDVQAFIDEAIAALPDKLREPVVYRFLEGQTYEAIARNLRISPSTVQYRVNKGLEDIRTFLKRRGVPVATVSLTAMLGANLSAEAAPATLTAALGKLAIASKVSAGTIGTAATGAALGGALIMKKALVGVVVVAAGVAGLWAVTQRQQPEPVEVAPEIAVAQVEEPSPEPETLALEAAGPMPETSAQDEPTVSENVPKTKSAGAVEGGAITGRVFDADTGKGIAGVVLEAELASADEHVKSSEPTNTSGYYRFKGLAGGEYGVGHGTLEGYRNPASSLRSILGTAQVVLDPTGIVEGVDFALRREALLAGIVVDVNGQPVEGAEVALAEDEVFGGGTHTQSDADGSFSFHGLPPVDDLCIQARKADTLVSASQTILLPEEGVTDLVLFLGPPSTISGTVVDGHGLALKDIEVWSQPVPGGSLGGPHTVSDIAGRYTLAGLAPGMHELTTRKAGSFGGAEGTGTLVELDAGDRITDLILVYDQALTISGHIMDTDGIPVVDATVVAMCIGGAQPAKTDEQGRYQVADLADGIYDLEVMAKGYRDARRNGVRAGADGVDFAMDSGDFAISGRVLCADTGEPITKFEVACEISWSEQLTSSVVHEFQKVSNTEGRFRFEKSQPTSYAIAARASGYATAQQLVYLGGSQREREVVFRLMKGRDLHGIVTTTSGEPMPKAKLFLGPVRNYGKRFTTTTTADGTFVLESFPKTRQLVSAYHPNYAIGSAEIPAEAELSEPVEIVLSEGGSIQGLVCFPSEYERLDWDVFIRYPERHYLQRYRAELKPVGTYEFAQLTAGEARIGLDVRSEDARTLRSFSRPVIIEDGRVTVADINVPEGSGVIEGTVSLGDEYGFERILLRLDLATPAADERLELHSLADGTYRMDSVPAGSGVLEVEAQMHSGERIEASVFVEIGEGEVVRQDIDLTG